MSTFLTIAGIVVFILVLAAFLNAAESKAIQNRADEAREQREREVTKEVDKAMDDLMTRRSALREKMGDKFQLQAELALAGNPTRSSAFSKVQPKRSKNRSYGHSQQGHDTVHSYTPSVSSCFSSSTSSSSCSGSSGGGDC